MPVVCKFCWYQEFHFDRHNYKLKIYVDTKSFDCVFYLNLALLLLFHFRSLFHSNFNIKGVPWRQAQALKHSQFGTRWTRDEIVIEIIFCEKKVYASDNKNLFHFFKYENYPHWNRRIPQMFPKMQRLVFFSFIVVCGVAMFLSTGDFRTPLNRLLCWETRAPHPLLWRENLTPN